MQSGQHQDRHEHGQRDHNALPLTRELEHSVRRRRLARMEHLVEHRLRIDRLLPGPRIGAAIGTELRRRIDIVMARRARDAVGGDVLRFGSHCGRTFISTENVDVTG